MIVPVLAVALLSGCAAPGADGANPLSEVEKVIDLIPWAKQVAADANPDAVVEKIEEIKAGLPDVNLPAETKADIEKRLTELGDAVAADPSAVAEHATELNAIIAEITAAL